jgi:hypothetical protein
LRIHFLKPIFPPQTSVPDGFLSLRAAALDPDPVLTL